MSHMPLVMENLPILISAVRDVARGALDFRTDDVQSGRRMQHARLRKSLGREARLMSKHRRAPR